MQQFTLPLLFLLLRTSRSTLVQMGPSFILEPPSVVQYSVAAGTKLSCVAKGDPPPRVAWLGDDGAPLTDLAGIRRVHDNGTLEIYPSSLRGYLSAMPASFHCRAANIHGTILSRDVTLRPVMEEDWEMSVSAPAVTEGSAAGVTCTASGDHGALIEPLLWFHNDRPLHPDGRSPESRYLLAGNSLLIRGASGADAGAYSCLVRHRLASATKRSGVAHLSVTPGSLGTAPRVVTTTSEIVAATGAEVCLPCVATAHPSPTYTWYRELNGRLESVGTGGGWLWAGGAALCLHAAPALAGSWLCKATNMYGDSSAQTRLVVREPLVVVVSPTVQVADTGSTVKFNCTVNGAASTRWLHDGVPVGGAERVLRVHGVARVHRGMYQCIATRDNDNAQAAAELRLGDTAPELHYTFIEQAMRAGGTVSLRCAVSGTPSPRFSWLLDGQPVDQFLATHRYSISEEVTASGDVVSVLNVSVASAADGGRYSCRAQNPLGTAYHAARLNIYGPPSIRALGPVRVVAGSNATVYCPYAGYPISSISWWTRGTDRAIGSSGRVSSRGPELRLSPALAADAGPYVCAVTAPDGTAARRDIELQVRNPPKISPFIFSPDLTEGSSVQVLCGVSSGDKPFYFSWVKDGAPIPASLQVQEKSLDEFSLLMFSDLSEKHSGDYTCRVSNHASTVNFTAALSVKVAPSWSIEPMDAAVLLGASLSVPCAARGYPPPRVSWFRKISESLGDTVEQWEEVRGPEWGGDVRAYNGTLTATQVSRPLQGAYRCRADNGVGPPLLKHVNVTVHEPAHFDETTSQERNVTSVRGTAATLACEAKGDPPLKVHWTHQSRRLDLDTYRASVSEARTGEGLRSTLQIRATERTDAGEYVCHAENSYGRSEIFVHLHVQEPPEAPRSLRLGGLGPSWVRVSWRGADAGASARHSALLAPVLPRGDTTPRTLNLTATPFDDDLPAKLQERSWTAQLEGLSPATAYSVRLFASNHVGQSPHSEPLLFNTLEDQPSAAPQNVRVQGSSAGELRVFWAAPPQDNWNGDILGYVVSWRQISFSDDADETSSGWVTAPGWGSSETVVSGLRQFARFGVTVRAFNVAGASPPSTIVYAATSDGVPESAPHEVQCEALSSRALRVRWAAPPGARTQLRGYELHYSRMHNSISWNGPLGRETARAGAAGTGGGEVTLQGLRVATNYSVRVRARSDAGAGPPSAPLYCATLEEPPGAAGGVRAVACGADCLLVSWLPPPAPNGRLTHYTLHSRHLTKSEAEWSERVEIPRKTEEDSDYEEEVWREVRGLVSRASYEVRVRAHNAAGPGQPSPPLTATTATSNQVRARVASVGREYRVGEGRRMRLRCASAGSQPLTTAWAPMPHRHAIDNGDLVLHRVDKSLTGNYTCTVRNAFGSDSVRHALHVQSAPIAPAPRLARADAHALHLAWDAQADAASPLLGYSLLWGKAESASPRSVILSGSESSHVLSGLACGAQYRVTLRAHNAIGPSLPSKPLLARTKGDRAKPSPGKEFVWANSTALRLNLLSWSTRCAVMSWNVALRTAAGGPWQPVASDSEFAEIGGLRSGTWYEVRATARAATGETIALYRAATLTANGERMGEPVELPLESNVISADAAGAADTDNWNASIIPMVLGGTLALALLAIVVLVALRRRHACRRACTPELPQPPHSQLYSTEPGKRNGKLLTPPDDIHEISPYATFSMAEGHAGVPPANGPPRCGSGCMLHMRTFGRAESLDLAAPPSRPNLLRNAGVGEYSMSKRRGGGDSDSESSGSPCAECAELYRLPTSSTASTNTPRGKDGGHAMESSAEESVYTSSSRGAARGRRRRDHHSRHSGPTARYFSSATLLARQEPL